MSNGTSRRPLHGIQVQCRCHDSKKKNRILESYLGHYQTAGMPHFLVSISFFNFLILWYSTKIKNIVTSADGKTLKDAVGCLNIDEFCINYNSSSHKQITIVHQRCGSNICYNSQVLDGEVIVPYSNEPEPQTGQSLTISI